MKTENLWSLSHMKITSFNSKTQFNWPIMCNQNGPKEVKESRGKLSNNEKLKFVGPGKMWDGERKFVSPKIYVNYHFHFPKPNPFLNSLIGSVWLTGKWRKESKMWESVCFLIYQMNEGLCQRKGSDREWSVIQHEIIAMIQEFSFTRSEALGIIKCNF